MVAGETTYPVSSVSTYVSSSIEPHLVLITISLILLFLATIYYKFVFIEFVQYLVSMCI